MKLQKKNNHIIVQRLTCKQKKKKKKKKKGQLIIDELRLIIFLDNTPNQPSKFRGKAGQK